MILPLADTIDHEAFLETFMSFSQFLCILLLQALSVILRHSWETAKTYLLAFCRIWGIIPLIMSECTHSTFDSYKSFPKSRLRFLSDIFCCVTLTEDSEWHQDNNNADVDASQKMTMMQMFLKLKFTYPCLICIVPCLAT